MPRSKAVRARKLNDVKIDEFYLLQYNYMYSVKSQRTFRRNILPLSLESKNTSRKKTASSRHQEYCDCSMLQAGFLFGLYFGPEDEPTCSSETSADFQTDSLSLLFYCCSHLEHRASVKRFVSLQLLNHKTVGRTHGRRTSPSQGRYLHRTTQTQNKRRQTN
jgi:hypothetical protein